MDSKSPVVPPPVVSADGVYCNGFVESGLVKIVFGGFFLLVKSITSHGAASFNSSGGPSPIVLLRVSTVCRSF